MPQILPLRLRKPNTVANAKALLAESIERHPCNHPGSLREASVNTESPRQVKPSAS